MKAAHTRGIRYLLSMLRAAAAARCLLARHLPLTHPSPARRSVARRASPAMAPHASTELDALFAAACTPTLGPPPTTPTAAASTVVLYHWPCFDGAGAALAAWLHLAPLAAKNDGGCAGPAGPVFIPHPVTRDLDPAAMPRLGPASTVYLLDYAGPPGFAAAVASRAGRVVVLDHHKTAAEELGRAGGQGGKPLPPNLEVRLDRGRSGAGLAAAHFFPPGGPATLPPNVARLLTAIEDGDLWVWDRPDSKAIYAGLGAAGLDLDAGGGGGGGGDGGVAPDAAAAVSAADRVFGRLAALDMDALAATGGALLAEQAALVGEAADGAAPLRLGGAAGRAAGWGLALGVTVPPALAAHRSALGNELASRAAARAGADPGAGWVPVGVVAYRDPNQPPGDGRLKVSLRSVGPDADTTVVSTHYGGGGHLNASSCLVEEGEFGRWAEEV